MIESNDLDLSSPHRFGSTSVRKENLRDLSDNHDNKIYTLGQEWINARNPRIARATSAEGKKREDYSSLSESGITINKQAQIKPTMLQRQTINAATANERI